MRKMAVFLGVLAVLPLVAWENDDSTAAVLRTTGIRVQKVTLLSREVLRATPAFLQASRFELLGKLMTVFQKGDDKAYAIKELERGRFSIRSRRTIGQGSTIKIVAMDKDHFIAYASLHLKKGVSFSCRAILEAWYRPNPEGVRCSTLVFYEAPLAVRGIDRGVAFFTGTGFVGRKTAGFLDRMNATLEQVAALSPSDWERISGDTQALTSLYFPVVFSVEEKHFITMMLQTPAESP